MNTGETHSKVDNTMETFALHADWLHNLLFWATAREGTTGITEIPSQMSSRFHHQSMKL